MSILRWCSSCVIAIMLAGEALAALSFNFIYLDDANGTFASRGWLDHNSLFQQNIRAAADLWGQYFESDATIIVRVDTVSYSARAGGTNSLGRFLYRNTQGKNVWEAGPLTRIRTGDNPGENFYGYDILLGFDAAYIEGQYWFDPQPELRAASVPANKGDFVSVALHEMGHGFGMTGFRDFATGQILGNVATQMDDLSYFGGNGNPIAPGGGRNPMFFSGDQASNVYGSDLPLTHKPANHFLYGQNFFHLSACGGGLGDGLEGTLMNGCVLPNGGRLHITPFDLAVYADMGYPVVDLPLTGDYNGNGVVDTADYVVWRDTLGESGVRLLADGNRNGRIDSADYAVWRSRFGKMASSGIALTAIKSPAVPEPASALILILETVGITVIPRRAFQRARVAVHRPSYWLAGRSDARWSSSCRR